MTRLKRALGFPSLTFYGVGLIIGAGIYSVIGAAAGVAGNALWWSFALAALIALLTGLSYAELATAYPEAGAEYVYVRHAFPGRRWAAPWRRPSRRSERSWAALSRQARSAARRPQTR